MKKDFTVNNKIDMSTYTKALELIEKSRYILIITHVNPDPDSIGSALALSNLFHENKIKHKVFNISSDLEAFIEENNEKLVTFKGVFFVYI